MEYGYATEGTPYQAWGKHLGQMLDIITLSYDNVAIAIPGCTLSPLNIYY